ILHPPDKQKYGEEIKRSTDVKPECIFDGSKLRDPQVINAIQSLKPDIGLSILFGYILRSGFLSLFPQGCINLHPAFLPYNRGTYPNVWSIIDSTPAGATIHYIDEKIDTGDIINQKEVDVTPVDTGLSLYRKLEKSSLSLFKETWPSIRSGNAKRIPQKKTVGTCHRTKDVKNIDEIDLDKTYSGRELINRIRARTFPPFDGAYFRHNGDKIYLRLQLLHEDEL
ncbi:MAG: formyltransferase family protein, partial [bacterium]|nr:formyltransferase family protein [bacterium]